MPSKGKICTVLDATLNLHRDTSKDPLRCVWVLGVMLFRKRKREKAVFLLFLLCGQNGHKINAQNGLFSLFSFCDSSFTAAVFGFNLTDNKVKTIRPSFPDTGMSFYCSPMIFPLYYFFTLSFNAFVLDLLMLSEARCCGNWNLGQNRKFSWGFEGNGAFNAEASSQTLFSGLRHYSLMSPFTGKKI